MNCPVDYDVAEGRGLARKVGALRLTHEFKASASAAKFFLSQEDDLMRIFDGNKVLHWVQKKGAWPTARH